MPTGPRTAILTMSSPGGGSSSGTPGGSDTQVQFNDGGSFGGDAGLVFNKTTNALTVGGVMSADDVDAVDDLTVGGDSILQGNLDLDSDAGLLRLGESQDVVLARDAADELAMRRSTNSQALLLYETYTDASNYGRVRFGEAFDIFRITSEAAGTGTARDMWIVSNGPAGSVSIKAGAVPGNFDAGRMRGTNGATESIQVSGHEATVDLGSGVFVQWGNASAYNGTRDLRLQRDEAGVLYLTDPNATGAGIQSLERSAPGTPPSTGWVMYAVDNGGKTEVLVKFDDGSTAQVCIQP